MNLKNFENLPTMYFAWLNADRTQSTLVPNEQYPLSSGGQTCTRAMSGLRYFSSNTRGISCNKIGMQSACPALTAALTLPPMKKLTDLKCSANNIKYQKIKYCYFYMI